MGLEGYKELVQVLSMESKLLVTPVSNSLQEPDGIYNDKKMIKDYHHLISDNLDYIEENFSENIIQAARAIRGSDRVFLFGKGANINTMRAFKNYLIKLDI
jgi:DNA-binding MurR/RpiR family transcriptional regulator